MRFDRVSLFTGGHRPHIDSKTGILTDPQRLHTHFQFIQELVVNFLLHINPFDPSARLPAVAESSPHHTIRRPVQIRVFAHDRVVEVRFGITNGSERTLRNLRCQICLRANGVQTLQERWPTASKLFSQGELVTWGSTGQDLPWLEPYKGRRRGHFTQSCFFLAPVNGYEPRDYPEKEQSRKDLMWFNRPVDIPAIAKVGPNDDGKAMIVYSPHGRNAFYNVLTPCFHADPHMNAIAAGETRWTSSFLVLFEGNLGEFFNKLTELHKTVARHEGYLESGSAAP